MQIYHNSQDKNFRCPQGAVKTGEKIRLALKVLAEDKPQSVKVRLWNGSEHYEDMQLDGVNENEYLYSTEITALKAPGLLWYCFEVKADNTVLYYTNNREGLGGVGETYAVQPEISYQITVYDKSFKTPDWFKNAVMYQIFPDRFCREGGEEQFPARKCGYRLHEDWYEDYYYDNHPFEFGPACNDFYGGNLKGIASKLDYLKELGISVIYLNPIFEAYSNHRYDTGNYNNIDPILGTEADFRDLCEKARKKGIRIILDGVFSHTGADSVYFNKYGTYGEYSGAMRDWGSPYGKWYQWNEDGSYNSWWGCSNLPNVNETEPTYIDYILKNKDAIIKKWLRLGASGWRLDVADELPDEFIKILRTEAKSEKSDAIIIGEVWEDASNKVSYSKRREYLFGDELDSVMNYPFKDGVLGFLLGELTAERFAARMLSIMENYPKEALYTTMNLIGTHDTMRIKTLLGGQHIDNEMSMTEKQNFRLRAKNETLAIKRLRLAAFIQMTFVGVPCIYYGDEIGMQGLADPFNRRPYTWRCADNELLDWYTRLTKLRNSTDCLRTGDFDVLYADGDVFVYSREISGGADVFGKKAKDKRAICCINRSAEDCSVEIEASGLSKDKLTGILTEAEAEITGDKIKITLGGYAAEVFFA